MTDQELDDVCSDVAGTLIIATMVGGILSWFGMALWLGYCLTHHCGR